MLPFEPKVFRVVGLQFARGLELGPRLTVASKIALRRNPQNPYDSNAIEVYTVGPLDNGDTIAPAMLGHMPRGMAAEVAPCMDERGLYLIPAAVMMDGEPMIQLEALPSWIVTCPDGTQRAFDTESDAVLSLRDDDTLLDPNQST